MLKTFINQCFRHFTFQEKAEKAKENKKAEKRGEKRGRKEGEKRGEKRGKIKGKIETLMKILIKKFTNENLEWIKDCNKEQLEKIEDNIYLDIDYKDFYQLVHS